MKLTINLIPARPKSHIHINGRRVPNKPILLDAQGKHKRNSLTIINLFLIFSILILGVLK